MQNNNTQKGNTGAGGGAKANGKTNDGGKSGAKTARTKYRLRSQPSTRIMLSISKGLLEQVDKAAEQDYTTRSDLIRMALLWYLRPQGRDLDQADPDVILKTLQHRKARAGMKKMLRETDIDVYD